MELSGEKGRIGGCGGAGGAGKSSLPRRTRVKGLPAARSIQEAKEKGWNSGFYSASSALEGVSLVQP